MNTRLAVIAAVLLGAAPSAQAQVEPSGPAQYQQTPAVLQRFADVPIPLDAPGLRPGATDFTTQDEMTAHLQAVKARAPGVRLGSMGRSAQGRDLPWLVFTAEGHQDLARIRRLNRPVVWLIGQQHGNEPAGGEAMLAVASALADGELKPLLRRVTVVVVPRANPDGAAAFTRRTSEDLDLNRDHLLASMPESRALQAAMVQLPADVVVDHHEYGVAGGWLPYGGLAFWDATLLSATHPAAPPTLSGLADTVIRPAMERRFDARGVTHHVYLTTPPPSSTDRRMATGGAAPGISRNYYGLTGAASILVETRGIGVGRQAFQRRVATHYLAAAGALEAAAATPGQVRRTAAAARRSSGRDRGPVPIDAELGLTPMRIPLIEPRTGDVLMRDVQVRDARKLTVTASRPRPLGYLLAPEATSVATAFRTKGFRLCPVSTSTPLAVEGYRVAVTGQVDRRAGEAINPDQGVTASVEPKTVTAGPGWLYAPMNQAGSAAIAASIEPDAPGSHVGVGLIRPAADGDVPLYRVMRRAPRTARCS